MASPQPETYEHPLSTPFPLPWASAWGQDRFGVYADFRVGNVSQRMRWIPSGTFRMGSPDSEEGRLDRETLHLVTLTQGFWLADTPCTQELWEAVQREAGDFEEDEGEEALNPSYFQSPKRPVERIRWEECAAFCSRLSSLIPGLAVRLPTEAEWEHACRAGTAEATWIGDVEYLGRNNAPRLGLIAWYGGNSGVDWDLEDGIDVSWSELQHEMRIAGSREVKGRPANPWGLYDMLGNVWEWCADWFGSYGEGHQINPAGPEEGSKRVIRGGAWVSSARYVRAAYRDSDRPDFRWSDLGFRLALGPGAERWSGSSQGERLGQHAGRDAPVQNEPRGRRSRRGEQRPRWSTAAGEDDYGRWAMFEVQGVQHRMRWIEPGTFTMGSPTKERGRFDSEGPQRHVTISRGFWLGSTPCTQDLWEVVMEENPSEFKSPLRPVERVSWHDCVDFFEKLHDRLDGSLVRLPTEAEWEFACRAGTRGSTYALGLSAGDRNEGPELRDIAWYFKNREEEIDLESRRHGTRPVAQKLANPWGLYDTLGNVYEWCSDWYGLYDPNETLDPTGPDEGSLRILRGGSWDSYAQSVRVANRDWRPPGYSWSNLGFRLVVDPYKGY
ncbi:MAG: formylglycine-generating enzyme family protein [Acidobacteriota bacterium]